MPTRPNTRRHNDPHNSPPLHHSTHAGHKGPWWLQSRRQMPMKHALDPLSLPPQRSLSSLSLSLTDRVSLCECMCLYVCLKPSSPPLDFSPLTLLGMGESVPGAPLSHTPLGRPPHQQMPNRFSVRLLTPISRGMPGCRARRPVALADPHQGGGRCQHWHPCHIVYIRPAGYWACRPNNIYQSGTTWGCQACSEKLQSPL
jgi:hypothetical protein